MNHAVTAWAALTAILAFLAVSAVWARRPTRLRGLSVLALVVTLPVTALAVAAPMGWGVPIIPLVTAPGGEHNLLGAKMVLGKGIYLFLDVGGAEPRHYWIPWDKQMADRLQEMMLDPEGGVVVRLPYEFSWWQGRPEFDTLPQPKILPDKPPQEPGLRYEQGA